MMNAAAEYIHKSDRRCVFSTCELEKGKVVLQLGTADATRALQATTVVMQVCTDSLFPLVKLSATLKSAVFVCRLRSLLLHRA